MSKHYPFEIEVQVQRRPNMLDDNLEYLLHVGKGVLQSLFVDECERPDVKEVKFMFPERWLNIIQERSLYGRLATFCPNLKKVMIVTQSVYIIQSTERECVNIISSRPEIEYGEQHNHLPQECNVGTTAFTVPTGYDFSKMQVVGG